MCRPGNLPECAWAAFKSLALANAPPLPERNLHLLRSISVLVMSLAAAFFLLFTADGYAQIGQCRISPPRQAYKLTVDTVEWQMEIAAGQNCLMGIRNIGAAGAVIEHVKLSRSPKSGRVTVQGPAFYYYTTPGFRGADDFEIVVTGRIKGINGISIVRVSVTVN